MQLIFDGSVSFLLPFST